MVNAKIIVVDDDENIRKLIKLYLENNNFIVLEASNGKEAMEILLKAKVDLAIVDIMMPYMDGVTLTEEIKSVLNIPIIMVTAKGESRDKVRGFQAGTDDYLVKPFDPVELVLRVKALLKRYNVLFNKVITIGSVTIDLERLKIFDENTVRKLKRKECELLFMLASSPGQIFTRDQLIDKIWGYDYMGDERTIDVHIKRLREQLKPYASLKIATVRGLGYRLEELVDEE